MPRALDRRGVLGRPEPRIGCSSSRGPEAALDVMVLVGHTFQYSLAQEAMSEGSYEGAYHAGSWL